MESERTTFWSAQTIRELLPELVADGVPGRAKQASYELSLGGEVFITTDDVKRVLSPDEQIVIPPGQMALLLTEECVTIPKDVLGFISIKYKHKLRGLVNVSGFHVDPGFEGRLVFSVYNAGPKPVPLTRGTAVFMVWFCSLDHETDTPYEGTHQRQLSITDDMVRELHGRIESPAALLVRMNELQRAYEAIVSQVRADFEQTRWKAAFLGLFLGAMFSGTLVPLATWAFGAAQKGMLGMPHVLVGTAVGLALGLVIAASLKYLATRRTGRPASGRDSGGRR